MCHLPEKHAWTRVQFSLMSGLTMILSTAAFSPPVPPQQVRPPTLNSGVATPNMTIVTDTMDANSATGDFVMPHHVVFTRPGTTVAGDSAHGNSKDDVVTITGNVVVNDSGNAPEGRAAGAPAGADPSTLTTDQLYIDAKMKLYIARGHVQFTQGSRHAIADDARLDQRRHLLELSSNVRVTQGESWISAGYIRYDTRTKDVSGDGTPRIFAPPPRIRSRVNPAPSPSSRF